MQVGRSISTNEVDNYVEMVQILNREGARLSTMKEVLSTDELSVV